MCVSLRARKMMLSDARFELGAQALLALALALALLRGALLVLRVF